MALTRDPEKVEYYRFRDPDPDMERVCNRLVELGWSSGELAGRIYRLSNGVCSTHYKTIDGWVQGKVRRPMNFNLWWAEYALGITRTYGFIDPDEVKEIPDARNRSTRKNRRALNPLKV